MWKNARHFAVNASRPLSLTLSLLPLSLPSMLFSPCPVLSPAADCDSGSCMAHPTLPSGAESLVSL